MKHASWIAPHRPLRDRIACQIAPVIALVAIGAMGTWIHGSTGSPAIAQTPQQAQPAIAPAASPSPASPAADSQASTKAGNWQRTLILWGAVGIGGLGALGGVMWLLRQSLNADHLDWDRVEPIDPDFGSSEGASSDFDDSDSGNPDWRNSNLGKTAGAPPVIAAPAPAPTPSAPDPSPAPAPPAATPSPTPPARRFPWQAAAGTTAQSPTPTTTPTTTPDPIAPEPAPAPASPSPSTALAATVPLPSPAALSPTRILQPSAIERAIQNLQSDHAADRRKAIWELGQRGDSRALRPLMEVLLNGDSKQRSLAIAALSAIGSRVLEPTLEAMSLALRDSNPDVRTNAIRDLSQVYEQVTRLSQMMGMAARDSDRQVQETATWALGKLEQIRVIAETVQSGQPLPTYQTERDGLAEGLALLETNRPLEAAPLLEAAIRHKPSDADAHLALAQALEARGAIAQAFYETLTARDLYAYQGRLDAAQAIEQAWRDRGLDPDRATYRIALANQLMQEAQWEQAQQELALALTENPHQPDAHLALARLHRAQHRSIEALAHLQQARDLYVAMGDRVAADRLQSLL